LTNLTNFCDLNSLFIFVFNSFSPRKKQNYQKQVLFSYFEREMPKRNSQRATGIRIEDSNEPGPSRRRTRTVDHMSNQSSLLNTSIDYVALVEQHLKDEQMAKELQREENNRRTHEEVTNQHRVHSQPTTSLINTRNIRPARPTVDAPNSANQMNEYRMRGSESGPDIFNDVIVEEDESSDNDDFHDADEHTEPDGEIINIDSEDEEDQDEYEQSFINDDTINIHRGRHGHGASSSSNESMDQDEEIQNSGEEEEFLFPARRQGVLISQPHAISPFHIQIQGNRDSLGSLLAARSASIGNRGLDGLEVYLAGRRDLSDVPVGLSASRIRQLPKSRATQSQVDRKEECVICMDSFELGVEMITLPCFHLFHSGCIGPWFKTKHECPVCRVDART
jgi:hypothetical protein